MQSIGSNFAQSDIIVLNLANHHRQDVRQPDGRHVNRTNSVASNLGEYFGSILCLQPVAGAAGNGGGNGIAVHR